MQIKYILAAIICTNPAGKSALGRAFHHTFGFSGLVKKKDGGNDVDLTWNDNTVLRNSGFFLNKNICTVSFWAADSFSPWKVGWRWEAAKWMGRIAWLNRFLSIVLICAAYKACSPHYPLKWGNSLPLKLTTREATIESHPFQGRSIVKTLLR